MTVDEPRREEEDRRCGFCKLGKHALCRAHRQVDCACDCRRAA